ncbi:MAG TPA: SLATT domain-containing protein [Candidatus Saccharimonadales bacterium]|jgi:hypothetical protein
MPTNTKQEMKKEAKRVEESAKYSAQTQFEYSKTWRSVDRWISAIAALIAAISGAGGLADVIPGKWAGLITLISAGLSAIAVSLGAPKTKTLAHASANAYLALQQDARAFINIDLDLLPTDEAREVLAKLIARHQELNNTAEIPSSRAWKKGKNNVEAGDQKYEVDG